MASFLIRLDVSNEFTIRSSTNDTLTSVEHVSDKGFRADLILAPGDDPEFKSLGFVRLHIEAQPENLPAMTPDETLEWLQRALKSML